ncbi:MAG: hypothetical protein FWG65_02285 [Turicibacter sp.]|nr:hypothetical protein [Turicibacter sp.]
MCKILGGTQVNDLVVIDYTPCDLAKHGTTLTILDEDNNVFATQNFDFEKFTRCFSTSDTQSVVTADIVPKNFLVRGNKIKFS